MTSTTDAPVLLYDGTCGFCAWSVRFVLRHERDPARLRFATLDGPFGDAVRAMRPSVASVDSVIWYDPSWGWVLVRSDALVAVLGYLGGPWRVLAALLRRVPRPIRDGAYDLIARHRLRLAGRATSCPIPAPAQRARFLG